MLEFTDVNCRIGEGPVKRDGAIENTAGLLELMDSFNVKKALVHHSVSLYSDARLGNGMLVKETAQQPRFIPQWAAQPQLWDISPDPGELLAEMKKYGASTVRLFPAHYGHSIKRYALGELMDALAKRRVPVFISLDQLSSWDELYGMCTDYPSNIIVLCSPGYRCLRYLVPIMDACPGLYVETSNFLVHNGIREMCLHMGADRLLFGSGVPEASLAASASQLLLSDISPEEKQMIASGNIARLLGEVSL